MTYYNLEKTALYKKTPHGMLLLVEKQKLLAKHSKILTESLRCGLGQACLHITLIEQRVGFIRSFQESSLANMVFCWFIRLRRNPEGIFFDRMNILPNPLWHF